MVCSIIPYEILVVHLQWVHYVTTYLYRRCSDGGKEVPTQKHWDNAILIHLPLCWRRYTVYSLGFLLCTNRFYFNEFWTFFFLLGAFRGLEHSFRKGFFALGNLAKVNITLCFSKRYVCISSLTWRPATTTTAVYMCGAGRSSCYSTLIPLGRLRQDSRDNS